MAELAESRHGMWSNRWIFILAAAGSAVGLGNIWKFPYITGENGGGAFVLVYLACIALIGIPVMVAEVTLGRLGRQSPINTMLELGRRYKRSAGWSGIGWLGVVSGFIILSFYAVIAGIVVFYVWRMFSGEFVTLDYQGVNDAFGTFVDSPWQLTLWFTVFIATTVVIVARGVSKGLEVAVRTLMPILLVLLGILVVFGITQGGMGKAFMFLFDADFSKLTYESVLVALGHAFFTLSIGMGAIMVYGAYVPSGVSIRETVFTIAILDTLVALIAGLAIFSIVFANDGDPAQSVSLLFKTVPFAYSQMPLGALFGGLFFVAVAFAALTSAISILEPIVAYLVEKFNATRTNISVSCGLVAWVLGLGSVFSFNIWSNVTVMPGRTIFDTLDHITTVYLLPIGGFLVVIYAAWKLPKLVLFEELNLVNQVSQRSWRWVIGVVAPVLVAVVFAYGVLAAFA